MTSSTMTGVDSGTGSCAGSTDVVFAVFFGAAAFFAAGLASVVATATGVLAAADLVLAAGALRLAGFLAGAASFSKEGGVDSVMGLELEYGVSGRACLGNGLMENLTGPEADYGWGEWERLRGFHGCHASGRMLGAVAMTHHGSGVWMKIRNRERAPEMLFARETPAERSGQPVTRTNDAERAESSRCRQ